MATKNNREVFDSIWENLGASERKKIENILFKKSYFFFPNKEDAEDNVQDTLLQAYKNVHQFRGDSAFYTWMTRICINAALMKLRKRGNSAVSLEYENSDGQESGYPRSEALVTDTRKAYVSAIDSEAAYKKMIELLGNVPDGQRELFVLRYIKKVPIKEIAEKIGKTKGTVKSQSAKGRKKLIEDFPVDMLPFEPAA